MKWRGYCDGYVASDNAEDSIIGEEAMVKSKGSSTKLIHTRKAPLILTEPDINTIRFVNEDQRLYFDSWSAISTVYLSGGLVQTDLWATTMPQLTMEETTLRYGAMAVGALRKALEENTVESLTTDNRHYMNAIVYYCEALRLQSKAKIDKQSLRTALLSSLLFICFETQRGNLPAALKHIIHGFTMLNELAFCSGKAPDLVSIAPAPPTMVQEILDCYKPLELQSRSFMGSYKKFFHPQSVSKGQATPAPSDQGENKSVGAQNFSPVSQPGTPWQAQARSPTVLGLPSPESQNSPGSRSNHAMSGLPSPQASPNGAPKGPPQRPPHIAPFTKHTPYFRPRLSYIVTLDDMPTAFADLETASGYWTLVQKQMVGHLPMLTMITSQLALTSVRSDEELDEKLSSVKSHPKISTFVATARFLLQRWIEAFEPYYRSTKTNFPENPEPYYRAANLRIEYLILYIYTAMPRYSGLITARGLTPQYKEIISLAETLMQARPNCGFAMDSGWTWPLFVSAFGCRDWEVRQEAIGILEKYPIRNALRDSRVFRAIALRNQETEYLTTMEGNEVTQWLRLRRREVVFEDFGSHIIYRSAQHNSTTGEWELVEEIAEHHINSDGLLTWRRQPISESQSILSGVC